MCDFFIGCRRESSYEKIRSKWGRAFSFCTHTQLLLQRAAERFPLQLVGLVIARHTLYVHFASFIPDTFSHSFLMVFGAVTPQNVTADHLQKRIHPQKHHVTCTRHTFKWQMCIISKNESWSMSELFKLWQLLSVMPGYNSAVGCVDFSGRRKWRIKV